MRKGRKTEKEKRKKKKRKKEKRKKQKETKKERLGKFWEMSPTATLSKQLP